MRNFVGALVQLSITDLSIPEHDRRRKRVAHHLSLEKLVRADIRKIRTDVVPSSELLDERGGIRCWGFGARFCQYRHIDEPTTSFMISLEPA